MREHLHGCTIHAWHHQKLYENDKSTLDVTFNSHSIQIAGWQVSPVGA